MTGGGRPAIPLSGVLLVVDRATGTTTSAAVGPCSFKVLPPSDLQRVHLYCLFTSHDCAWRVLAARDAFSPCPRRIVRILVSLSLRLHRV